MIEKLGFDHIDQIVEIHASSWNSNEFSVKLGKQYIQLFYRCILEFPEAVAYVSKDDHKNIIAYATGFLNYAQFNRKLKRKCWWQLLIIVLTKFIQGKLSPLDVYAMFKDGHKTKNVKNPLFHLGALAVRNEYKSSIQGLSSLTLLIKEVHKEIAKHGGQGCWGACDEKNQAMKKLFECMGYKLVDRLTLSIKNIAVYEKILP